MSINATPRTGTDPAPAAPGFALAEEDLRLVAESIPHIVWVAGPDGTTEFINRWALEYGGATADQIGRDSGEWLAAVHPDDVAGSAAAWVAAAHTGTPYELDFRLRRADGQYRWHHFRNLPLRDDEGRVRRWIGTATDVHDQKELEEGLRRSQREAAHALALLETLLSAAPVGIGFLDRDFRFVHLNDTLAAMTGGLTTDQVGLSAWEVAPDLWPQVSAYFERVRDTGEAVIGQEVTGASPADPEHVHSWLASFYPVTIDAGTVGVGLAAIDITARVEAEQFRSVVMDNMAEGLCTIDEDGVLLSMNEAASRILGWSQDELRGLPVAAAINFLLTRETPAGEPDPRGGPEPRAEADPPGGPGDGTLTGTATVTRADGAAVPVSYSVAPLRVGAKVGGQVVVFRDITDEQERQRREIESRHDQKLESLGRLSAGIAHEINTPIQFVGDNTRFLATSCQQMLDLIVVYRECLGITGGAAAGEAAGDAAAPVPWEQRLQRAAEAEREADVEYLAEEMPAAVAQSLEGIERVASLVRAMKSFSYKDGGNAAYADLNEALETTLTVARNEVKYVADVALDLGELPQVLCHVGDLNQVFLNLLVNAADAMRGRDGRGEIRVATRLDGATAVVSIADNGSGIPAELQQVIFEPFFTTKEVGRGTGQGLALARSVVVDKHGGTIEVRSAPGEGTEFVLRLPVDGRPAAGPSREPA